MKMIMVAPAVKGDPLLLESGTVLTDVPAAGVKVPWTLFVKRRIAAGEQINVTPEGGVPEADEAPSVEQALATLEKDRLAKAATTAQPAPAAVKAPAPAAPTTSAGAA